MTEDHFAAVLESAGAKKDKDGWAKIEGRHVSLYVAQNGASLTVGRVEALRLDKGLVYARNSKNETYVLALADVFAGAVESPAEAGRKAGFV